jgi:hypothetical protein
VLPVGVARAGAWKYSFIYEVVARYYPDLPEQARPIGEAEARQKLVELYFRSVGAARARDVNKLFGWPGPIAAWALARLVDKGVLASAVTRTDLPGEWFALRELVK